MTGLELMFEHNFHPRSSPQHDSRTQKLPSTLPQFYSICSFPTLAKMKPTHPSIHLSIAHRHPLVNFSQRWLGTWISKSPYGVLGVSSGVAFQTQDPAVGHPEFERCPEIFWGSKPSRNPRNGSFIWRFAIVFVGRFAMRKPSDWNTGLSIDTDRWLDGWIFRHRVRRCLDTISNQEHQQKPQKLALKPAKIWQCY